MASRTALCLVALAAIASLVACGAPSVSAPDAPGSRIRYIVPFSPGGGTDTAARETARTLSSAGISHGDIYVENVGGAGGLLGIQTLVRQGDDNTLMQWVDVLAPLYREDSPIHMDQLRPVAQLATSPLILVTATGSRLRTFQDLVAGMAADEATFGLSSTLKSKEPATWQKIARARGVDPQTLNFVPSKGVSQVVPDVVSGRIDVALVVPSLARSYIDKGDLRALAVTSDERLDSLPGVPTLRDQGLDVSYYRAQGVVMSAAASDEAVAYWAEALRTVSRSEEWARFAEKNGLIVQYKGPDEYGAWLRDEGDEFGRYLQERG
jgi:putative tricarboxylic transport membrane protein